MESLLAAEAAGAGSGGGYWQLALVLAGIGFLGLFARWRKANRRPPVDARQLRERDQTPNRYREAADQAIVDLLETSRELNAQVDTKIRILNRLVKDAEEQAARLERLLALSAEEETGGTEDSRPSLPSPPPAAPEPPARVFRSELHERIFRLREEGKSIAEIAKTTSLSTTEVRFAIESME